MTQNIPFEDWNSLNDQAQRLYLASEGIDGRGLEEGQMRDFLQNYLSEFKSMLMVIEETQQKCSELMKWLEHDFGNYINPLSISVTAYLRRPRKEYLESIRKNQYINRIVMHVVASVRYFVDGKVEVRPVNLARFMELEKRALDRAFGPGRVKYGQIPELEVEIDEDMIANVLLNMAKNAVRHGEADLLFISAWEEERKMKLSIADNGMGIDCLPEEQNLEGKVSDIFRNGMSRHGSSGLGLADLEKRMELMRGDVSCFGHGGLFSDKHKDCGAQFVFTFPISKAGQA